MKQTRRVFLFNSPMKLIFRLWEDTGVSGKKTQIYGKSMETLRKGPSWDSNQGLLTMGREQAMLDDIISICTTLIF